MFDPEKTGCDDAISSAGRATVTSPVVLRGDAASDRKIRSVSPIWHGLDQTPPPIPETYEKNILKQAPNAAALAQWAANRACLAKFCQAAAFTLPPVLLHGPNGVGKTSLAGLMAQAAGLTAQVIPVSGKNDPRTFLGTSPGYTTGLPALPIQVMARTGRTNPVIIIDEIDKQGQDPARGTWTDALLPFLEPATSVSLFDEFLGVDVNYSAISWVFTANVRSELPLAFLDRVTCFEFPEFVGPSGLVQPPDHSDAAIATLAQLLGLPQHRVAHVLQRLPNPPIWSFDEPKPLSPRQCRAALLDRFAEAIRGRRDDGF